MFVDVPMMVNLSLLSHDHFDLRLCGREAGLILSSQRKSAFAVLSVEDNDARTGTPPSFVRDWLTC